MFMSIGFCSSPDGRRKRIDKENMFTGPEQVVFKRKSARFRSLFSNVPIIDVSANTGVYISY